MECGNRAKKGQPGLAGMNNTEIKSLLKSVGVSGGASRDALCGQVKENIKKGTLKVSRGNIVKSPGRKPAAKAPVAKASAKKPAAKVAPKVKTPTKVAKAKDKTNPSSLTVKELKDLLKYIFGEEKIAMPTKKADLVRWTNEMIENGSIEVINGELVDVHRDTHPYKKKPTLQPKKTTVKTPKAKSPSKVAKKTDPSTLSVGELKALLKDTYEAAGMELPKTKAGLVKVVRELMDDYHMDIRGGQLVLE